MANGTGGVRKRRRPSQKGVQAVFTPESSRRQTAQLFLGLFTLAFGAAAWAYSTHGLGELGLDRIPWNNSFSSILLPISIPLLILGVGLCTYHLSMRKTWRASARIESAIDELEALIGQKNPALEQSSPSDRAKQTSPSRNDSSSRFSKALFLALAEGVLLVSIFGGLVQEYASNAYMQNWVKTNFSVGIYFLNFNGVLALAGILGVLIFRFVPRSLRSKES